MTQNSEARTPLDAILEVGRELEPKFALEGRADIDHYLTLFGYFKGKELDPKKGLLIMGDIGTGKTLSMRVMQAIFRSFSITPTRYVVRDFLADGHGALDAYGRNCFKKNPISSQPNRAKPIAMCFDDFAVEESTSRSYGNFTSVMEEVVFDRYTNFIEYGMVTHFTTNADANIIEKKYGARIRDRVREMCNIIKYTGNSKRN